MDSKVENILKELKNELIKDEEYIRYKKLEMQIKQEERLYNKLREFKKLKVNNALYCQSGSPIDTSSRINILYTEIFFDDLIREYLILEKLIIDKINKIMEEIYSVYKFELDFLKED